MLARPLTLVRVALLVFVLAWLFAPYELRSTIPIWLPFLIALGLELHFFVGAFRAAPSRRPDRGPQAIDLERYGYPPDEEELNDEELDEEELDDSFADVSEEPVDEPVADERPRRPVGSLLAGVGVIGLLAVALWAVDRNSGWSGLGDDTRAEATARFSDAASRVAEKPVTIRCDESGGRVGAVQHTDGVAIVGGDVAYLTPERCFDLYRLAFEGEAGSSRIARALAVLAHEAWHLRGVADEGTTECYALQSAVDVGRRLGLSTGTARRLMRQQLTENALRTGSSSEYRVPGECRDGGALDLDPADSSFP
jgi:hypothetical protein